jgi:hypothetical protein
MRVGGTAARSVAIVGLVLNVALIPIDLVEIVRSSLSLAGRSQTKAVKQLEEIVEQLKQQLSELRSAILYQQTENRERDQAGMGSEAGPDTEPGTRSGARPDTEPGIGPGAGPGAGSGTRTETGTETETLGMRMGPGTEIELEPIIGSGTEHK